MVGPMGTRASEHELFIYLHFLAIEQKLVAAEIGFLLPTGIYFPDIGKDISSLTVDPIPRCRAVLGAAGLLPSSN